ncbi:MAG: 2-keto-3-deoxy-D-arabino-heptulosonate-7-phosphate synthase I beta, partial [uncultured Thermomicrobiales bacterium]
DRLPPPGRPRRDHRHPARRRRRLRVGGADDRRRARRLPGRDRRQVAPGCPGPAGHRRGPRRPQAVHAGQQGAPRPERGSRRRGADRRWAAGADGGAVRGRGAGIALARGRGGQGGRGRHPARGRVQAPHLPLRLPGVGRGRPAPPGRRPRGDRVAGGDRGDGAGAGGPGRPLRRYAPGRRPEHGQLPPLAAGGRGGQAGPAETRFFGHRRGMADERRVPAGGRQPGRGPLRTGHPRLRPAGPLHLRPERGAVGQGVVPSAGHRRPQPRHRQTLPGDPDGPRRTRRRGGRPDRGSPPGPRQRPLRRRPNHRPGRTGDDPPGGAGAARRAGGGDGGGVGV